jgi:hypothetical protein
VGQFRKINQKLESYLDEFLDGIGYPHFWSFSDFDAWAAAQVATGCARVHPGALCTCMSKFWEPVDSLDDLRGHF